MEFSPETFPAVPFYKGPVMVGFIMCTVLFGATIPAWMNYMHFSYGSDRRGTRVLVWAVTIMALLQIGYELAYTMRVFAFRFGLKPVSDDAKWDSMNFLLGGTTHALVAGFFARRAWMMYGRSWYLGVIFVALILVTSVGAIGAAIAHIQAPLGTRSHMDVVFTHVLLIGQMVGDLVISILIVIKLLSSRTGWKTTDSIIQKLIVIGIETQAPPTCVSIGFLVTFVSAPYPTYILAFVFFPQTYALCFFAALNSRYTISARMGTDSTHARKSELSSTRRMPTAINVTTEVYTHAGPPDVAVQEWQPTVKRGPSQLAASTESLKRGPSRLADSTESLEHDDSKDYNGSEVRLV